MVPILIWNLSTQTSILTFIRTHLVSAIILIHTIIKTVFVNKGIVIVILDFCYSFCMVCKAVLLFNKGQGIQMIINLKFYYPKIFLLFQGEGGYFILVLLY